MHATLWNQNNWKHGAYLEPKDEAFTNRFPTHSGASDPPRDIIQMTAKTISLLVAFFCTRRRGRDCLSLAILSALLTNVSVYAQTPGLPLIPLPNDVQRGLNYPLVRTGAQTADGIRFEDFHTTESTAVLSINDNSQLAFSAYVSYASASYLAVFTLAPQNGSLLVTPLSFVSINAYPDLTNYFVDPWIANSGQVAYAFAEDSFAFQLYSSNTLISYTPENVGSIALSSSGTLAWSGSTSTQSGLFIGSGGAPSLIAGNVSLVTGIADDGTIVGPIDNDGYLADTRQIELLSPKSSYQPNVITPSNITIAGYKPGISSDGSRVSYWGADNQGLAVFVYDATSGTATSGTTKSVIRIGTQVQVDYVQPSNGVDANLPTISISGLPSDEAVAVEKIDSFLGQTYRVAFLANDTTPRTALYTARLSADGRLLTGLWANVYDGEIVNGETFSNIIPATSHYINGRGDVAYSVSLSTPYAAFGTNNIQAEEIVDFRGFNFTKYKQVPDGNPINNWWNQRINASNPNANPFWKQGCVLTALATVSSISGKEVTPLDMRDYLSTKGYLTQSGAVQLSDMVLKHAVVAAAGSKSAVVAGMGNGFASIVSQLLGQNPVLLRVPGSTFLQTGGGTELHAIVAYALNPGVTQASATPADVLVSDPGYVTFYKYSAPYSKNSAPYLPRYGPGEERVNVTLQDVFDRINVKGNGKYYLDINNWFNTGTYTWGGTTSTLGLSQLNALEIYFNGVTGSSSNPHALINSPVNVIFTDSATGQRYVSDPTLARPGDVILSKNFQDDADFSDEDGDPGEFTPEPYPAYNVDLPPSLLGKSLDVTVIGTGNGPFSVSLFEDSDLYKASVPITGTISLGQTIRGSFVVIPAASVPFAASAAKLEITGSGFQLNESFTLGTGSNGINPLTENVTLEIGTYSLTIPAGSLLQNLNGRFAFQGVINGVSLQVQIVPLGNQMFTFKAEGTGVDLTSLTNPVTVVLNIGNDAGSTMATAQFQ
jgi:hypothetical protein